jgi:hypothetical protein
MTEEYVCDLCGETGEPGHLDPAAAESNQLEGCCKRCAEALNMEQERKEEVERDRRWHNQEDDEFEDFMSGGLIRDW